LFDDLQVIQPKGVTVAEEESNISSTEDEDVEAHGNKIMASDEPRDDAETEKDDDVELHGSRRRVS